MHGSRTFIVSRATIDDADGVLACVQAAFALYRRQYTVAGYEDTVMTPLTVRRRIETMTVLAARDDRGVIVGTVGGVARAHEGHIRGMAVLPEWQGCGVAVSLLRAIERELLAAGCSLITLDTTAPLARAIRFYERNGYVRSSVVADFFGMPLYQYWKRLGDD